MIPASCEPALLEISVSKPQLGPWAGRPQASLGPDTLPEGRLREQQAFHAYRPPDKGLLGAEGGRFRFSEFKL